MKHTKKFEEHIVVNSGDLGNNWSAVYKVNKAKGLIPYIKKADMFIEVNTDKSIPQNVIYMTKEKAKKLNFIGSELNRLRAEQKELLNESVINESTMNIIDISKVISRMGMDEDVVLEWLQQAFRKNGDQGVIDVYKGMTGIEIEALSKGRYVFKH